MTSNLVPNRLARQRGLWVSLYSFESDYQNMKEQVMSGQKHLGPNL